jgi:signal transduction histidine kinase
LICHDPLRLVEQAAVAEEVMSALRHDFRNRMTAVRNGAFYVQRRLTSSDLAARDPRIVPFLRIMDEETDAACKLLEDTAAARHLHTPAVATIAVASCIEDALRWARSLRDDVKVSIACDDSQVVAEPSEITLALRCLIENAAEAMADPGAISVQTRRNPAYVRIVIADSGPGLRGQELTTLAERFFSTKKGHAGLGLAIARRIARRYQGEMTMDDVAEGASFTLTLPVAGNE